MEFDESRFNSASSSSIRRSSRSTRFSRAWQPGQLGFGSASVITHIHRLTSSLSFPPAPQTLAASCGLQNSHLPARLSPQRVSTRERVPLCHRLLVGYHDFEFMRQDIRYSLFNDRCCIRSVLAVEVPLKGQRIPVSIGGAACVCFGYKGCISLSWIHY